MRKCTLLLAALAVLLAPVAALAAAKSADAGKLFADLYPGVTVVEVRSTPIKGVSELLLQADQGEQSVVYFDAASRHVLVGELWAPGERTSLTKKRMGELMAKKFGDLPLDKAVKVGNGPIKVIEVTDPDCPFCRRASQWLGERQDQLTRYIFFAPLDIHPKAPAKSAYILGSADAAAAYKEVYSGKFDTSAPPTVDDKGRLAEHKALAAKLGVSGVPVMYIGGEMVVGADFNALGRLIPAPAK